MAQEEEVALVNALKRNTEGIILNTVSTVLATERNIPCRQNQPRSIALVAQVENAGLSHRIKELEKQIGKISILQAENATLKAKLEKLEQNTAGDTQSMRMDTFDIPDDRFFNMIRSRLEDEEEE
jgi:BMFP domain-containing protein YqiC